jgi:fermentation-respiration switch protein FrsA (DUF1100 family)
VNQSRGNTREPPPGRGAGQQSADQPAAGAQPSAQARPRRWTRWRIFKWAVRGGVLLFVVTYLGCVGLDGFFYYPDRKTYERPDIYGLEYEDVRFQTADGLTLAGWFLPAALGRPARGTVVHFHGNAANITGHLLLVSWLPQQGYNVLMFDYRGYGRSEGKPTRAGTIKDGNAAVDYALSRPDVRGRPLFAYGQSLGGAVAVVVAADRPEIAAVIAESPFSGYRRVAARHLQKRLLISPLARGLAALCVSGGYDPIEVVGRIAPRPLLVVVAGNDQICFPDLGRELFDAAGAPKEFWEAPGSEHLGILDDNSSGLIDHVTTFLDRAGGGDH